MIWGFVNRKKLISAKIRDAKVQSTLKISENPKDEQPQLADKFLSAGKTTAIISGKIF